MTERQSRIYSIYLAPDEEELVRQIAALNGTSLSFVVRVGVRALARLPVPKLELPALPGKAATRTD